MEKHLQGLLPQQKSTPQGRLTSTFLQESTETSVQRRLFNLTPTPNQRKKPRLLEELEAESDSALEDSHQAKAKAREQAELPYIIRDQWDIDGERITVYVLYAAGQALPFHNGEVVAGLLGKLHEPVIAESNTGMSLSSSMALLGIPANSILKTAVVV
ncbi:hypothetical protein V8C40DRAFT_179806 [Trichoderma camerunense]